MKPKTTKKSANLTPPSRSKLKRICPSDGDLCSNGAQDSIDAKVVSSKFILTNLTPLSSSKLKRICPSDGDLCSNGAQD